MKVEYETPKSDTPAKALSFVFSFLLWSTLIYATTQSVISQMAYVSGYMLAEWRERNTPKACPITGKKIKKPVVDHDHKTGKIRGVIDSLPNMMLGKIENFHHSYLSDHYLPDLLRNFADYLEKEEGNIYHPIGLTQVVNRFGRLPAKEQRSILFFDHGIEPENNSDKRKKQYRKVLKG